MRPVSDEGWVVNQLIERGQTVATGESLTGGLLCARLIDVPGASGVVRGGTVAYVPETKISALGVPPALIEAEGTVSAVVAERLAAGARTAFAADIGLGTTGVAGPGPHEGKAAGTVFVAVADSSGVTSQKLQLVGTRHEIRDRTVSAALQLLADRLKE